MTDPRCPMSVMALAQRFGAPLLRPERESYVPPDIHPAVIGCHSRKQRAVKPHEIERRDSTSRRRNATQKRWG